MQAKKELLIETKNGFLRGTIERSVENFYYCAFKGVPYAKPPINELRFKVSQFIIASYKFIYLFFSFFYYIDTKLSSSLLYGVKFF